MNIKKHSQKILNLVTAEEPERQKEGLTLMAKRQDYSLLPVSAKLIACKNEDISNLAKKVSLNMAKGALASVKSAPVLIEMAASLIKNHDKTYIMNLYDDLHSHNEKAVVEAIINIKHFIDEKSARETLKSFIKHSSKKVRATAALHIGMIASRNSADALTKYLEDNDNRVKANTIEVLESLKNKNLLPIISRFRNDPNNRIRGNVLKALYTIGKTDIKEDLIVMLTHEDKLMRTTAVWVIGEIGSSDPGYLELLKLVADDPYELIVNNLLIVVKKVGGAPEADFLQQKLKEKIKENLRKQIIRTSGIEIKKHKKQRYTLLKLAGSLTANEIVGFRMQLEGIISDTTELILDFKEVGIIDSTGISLLINFSKKVEQAKGFFFICNCNYRINELFQLTKVDKALSVFQTEEEIRNFILA